MEFPDKKSTPSSAGASPPVESVEAREDRERGALQERRRWLTQERIVTALAAVTFLVFALLIPGFFTIGNVLTLARGVSILGILGVAMAIVVLGRGLDLSQTAIYAMSSAWSVQLMGQGLSVPAAVAAGFGTALGAGVLNGVIIAYAEVPPLMATLASGILYAGFARSVLLDSTIAYVPGKETAFLRLGQGRLLGIPHQIILFALVALFAHVLLKYTRMGRFIYAQGDNPEAARNLGIGVRRLTVFTFAISALIAAFAGLIAASSMASMDLGITNTTLVFDVLLVVVLGGVSLLGGRGSIAGVVAATGLIGTLLNGLTIMNVDNTIQDIARSLVLLAAILLDIKLHPRDEETSRQGDI